MCPEVEALSPLRLGDLTTTVALKGVASNGLGEQVDASGVALGERL